MAGGTGQGDGQPDHSQDKSEKFVNTMRSHGDILKKTCGEFAAFDLAADDSYGEQLINELLQVRLNTFRKIITC
jgi:hypothetical protein